LHLLLLSFFFSLYRGSLSTRIIGGILVEVAVFVLTVVLAMLESSQWPGAFFWTTMGSVVILNSKFFY
jgi:equilibrative nucleoside transporter 1/2/3